MNFNPFKEPWKLFNWLKNLGFKHTGLAADYKVGYEKEQNLVIVAFKETDGKFDWLMNLCFMPFSIIFLFEGGFAFSFGGVLIPVFVALAAVQTAIALYVLVKYRPKTLMKFSYGMAEIFAIRKRRRGRMSDKRTVKCFLCGVPENEFTVMSKHLKDMPENKGCYNPKRENSHIYLHICKDCFNKIFNAESEAKE